MNYLFGVNFSGNGKLQYFLSSEEIRQGDLVICDSPRGIELGRVASFPKEYEIKEGADLPFSFILRIANESDIRVYEINQSEAKEAIKLVQKEADNLNLGMKVTSAEYTLDRSKLTVSYLADDRVDFRELLKILASLYHCRIELRQIGPRDKAKMIGGIGICGLPLCCSTFLNEFDGISITMAKNQMLALNIPKLSGHCGKLICCLKYEDEVYTLEKKDLPRIGLRVQYNDTVYRIASINILTRMVRLEAQDSVVVVPLSALDGKVLTNYNPNQKPKKEEAKENNLSVPNKEREFEQKDDRGKRNNRHRRLTKRKGPKNESN